MRVEVYKDYQKLSEALASQMVNAIETKPNSLFCLATGDTPKLAYAFFVKEIQKRAIDTTKCFFIGLDEWLGVSPMNQGSCHYFLYKNVFSLLGIDVKQTHLFNALTNDEIAECGKMNKIIEEKGGIDLMVAGIGMNGHIGFNEPGVNINKKAHVTDLDATTQTIGQKYFQEQVSIKRGITLGLSQVIQSKKLLMAANGTKKAAVVKKMLQSEVSNTIPASYIRNHLSSIVFLDNDAAAKLAEK